MARTPRTRRTPKKGRGAQSPPPEPRPWEESFLAALAEHGNIAEACRVAPVGRSTAYDRREADPEFRRRWDQALTEATEALELEARRRATRPRRPSDLLLIFLLKAHAPAKYRDNHRHEITGPDGQPMTMTQTHVYIPDNGRGDNPDASQPPVE